MRILRLASAVLLGLAALSSVRRAQCLSGAVDAGPIEFVCQENNKAPQLMVGK